ncbi:unnamed protein product [Scytosiphon promiscuus]
MGPKLAVKVAKKVVVGIVCGVSSIVVSTVTNAVLAAVVLVRFVVMILLRSLSSTVTFVGETAINTIYFFCERYRLLYPHVCRSDCDEHRAVYSQPIIVVSVWRLVATILTATLGETCYLAHTSVGRIFDFISDYMLSLQAFSAGLPGLAKVFKAQATDVQTGVNLKSIISQAMSSFIDTVVYLIIGDEKKFSDGLVPNLFTEVFKTLPLSFDLGKVILTGTVDIAKETLSTAFSSLKELTSLSGIMAGCRGTAS